MLKSRLKPSAKPVIQKDELPQDLLVQGLSGKEISTEDVVTKIDEKITKKIEDKIRLPTGQVIDVEEEDIKYVPTSVSKQKEKPETKGRRTFKLSDDELDLSEMYKANLEKQKTSTISSKAYIRPPSTPRLKKTTSAPKKRIILSSDTEEEKEEEKKMEIIPEKITVKTPEKIIFKSPEKTKELIPEVIVKETITEKEISKPEKIEIIIEPSPSEEIIVKKIEEEPKISIETQPTEILKEVEEKVVKTTPKESMIEKLRKETEKVKPYGPAKTTTIKMRAEEIIKPELKTVEFPITKEARITIREFLDSMIEKPIQPTVNISEKEEKEEKEFKSKTVTAPKLKLPTTKKTTSSVAPGKEEEDDTDERRKTIDFLLNNMERIADISGRKKTDKINYFKLEELRDFATKLGIKPGTANKKQLVEDIKNYLNENK
jgi:hypothetical protein